MTDHQMERLIEAARDYNQPPDTPREEMWAVIRARLPVADDLSARRSARSTDRLRQSTPWAIGLAAAATLAVGFGLGRLSGPPVVDAPATVAAGERAAPSRTVRLAAAEHMSDAEALLTMFRSSPASTDRGATVDWARDLLGTTRLLLDSRVADDPEMASLLADLELVLVQIANAGDDGDRDLIEEGIRQQQLLPKLRTAAAPADIAL